ncbi:unnamed protein product [Heligmosomoides polygyrus]|uniref:Neur_chan_LBD domain-containing protein n=1 Tax=Heligmosomoides polygyrus TaxID=6339 RepID=A0A183GPM4_HELPZ|nr:unnamed protein product [Heligmosomoides polygyrus]
MASSFLYGDNNLHQAVIETFYACYRVTETFVDYLVVPTRLEWVDERLKWSPDDYCDIENIYVNFEDVWIPEITVVEAHSSIDYRENYRKSVWVKKFPFDEQRCSINVMAQAFSVDEYGIDAVYDPAILGNGEWQVLNISVVKQTVNTGQSVNSYEISRFVFLLKRNPSFYITMVILPSFVINVLSILGVFLKAADSMGKDVIMKILAPNLILNYYNAQLGMALTNIMSLTFILGILATVLPKTEELPKIGENHTINFKEKH